MTETLDPLSPSVNSSGGSASSFINKIRLRIRPGNQSRGNGEGYVEFGEFRADTPSVKKVGTFAGVVCPVVLSMFSALVFFRMGYLIGNAGLLVTIAQFGIAYLIVLFTVISICAISTNGAIEGGGVYFMISRTLGPEFGGAIGTLFFFANVVSSALCISACTEALVENFGPGGYIISATSSGIPNGWWYRFLYRSILNVAGLCVSLCGASLFARTSLLIWAVMSVCLTSAMLSFITTQPGPVEIPSVNTLVNVTTANYTGFSSATLYENLYPEYGRDYTSGGTMVDFASVFGVLFTGVTGVMAGANMSGELKTPSRSIPVGTLTALLMTGLAYLALSVLTAATCSRDLLQNNYMYLLPINVWKPFIAVGMLLATFSAGLSNLIGASRVLEALAKDNIFGCLLRPMATVRSGNPVVAVIASWLLVQVGITADGVNAIAQVNSVLFMSSYFAINLACLGLELASAPNFRPSFKHFNWVTCVSGLVGCAGVMFSLRPAQSAGAALSAVSLLLALHVWSPASNDHTWGSLSQALIFHQVRKYLLLLDPRRQHVKFWRPQMLLLVSSPRQQAKLIDFINVQKKGGLFVLGYVRIGQLDGNGDPLEEEYKYWLQLVDHLKVKAFVELCLSESIRSGASQLSRLSGLGAMKPDTVVIGFRDHQTPTDAFTDPLSPYRTDKFECVPGGVFPARPASRLSSLEYVHILSDVVTVNKNLVIARQFTYLDMDAVARKSPLLKYLDVWLIPPLSPRTSDEAFSVRGHFSLQLAAVVRSARGWQHLLMRTFIVPTNHTLITEEGRTVSVESGISSQIPAGRPYKDRLVELLKLIRINATVHVVDDWPTLDQSARPNGSESNQEDQYQHIPLTYLEQVNKIIRDRCREGTAVTFIQLPTPPKLNDHNHNQHTADQYLNILDEITKDLPPTLLVYGLKTVTSTAL